MNATSSSCAPHQAIERREDPVLDRGVEGAGAPVVQQRTAALVSTFVEHPPGRHVPEDIVGIADGPDVIARKVATQAQRVVDDHFSAKGHEREVRAEAPDLQRHLL